MDMPDTPAGVVHQLAAYIAAAREEPLSAETEDAALRCVFDLLGATVAGLDDPGARAVHRVATTPFMGHGTCPIWFTGKRGSVAAAAWANSAAASAMDLDDGHRLARGHPGAAIIPAVFAVGSECGATPDEMLRAIVIGYEVGIAVGAARTTYGNTGTWAPYGVVAAVASLRRTPADQVAHALAIAGESAPNQLFASAPLPRVPTPEGSAVKEGIPWSVVTGLAALALAEAGHTGPRNILDSAGHYRFPDLLDLGRSPRIGRTYFKLYACCRHVHPPLDALLGLLSAHALDPADITAVEVEAYSGALRISNRTHPTNLVDAQYSIPYCLGLAALKGPSALLPITPDILFQAGASAFAERVTLRCAPDLEARFPAETVARVTVVHRGRRYVSPPTSPRGDAANPLGWPELEAKFRAASRFAATPAQQATVLDAMQSARTRNFGPLATALAGLDLTARAAAEPAAAIA